MAPRNRNRNRLPSWRRDSPFFNEINSLEAFELLAVPAQDSQMLNHAVDEWERLDPVVKDYLQARMQYQTISAFNLLRQRLDRAIDHLASIRTGTRLIEAQGRPEEPPARPARPAPQQVDPAEFQGHEEADFGEMTEAEFEKMPDADFVAAAQADIRSREATTAYDESPDTFALDHDPWADNGGAAPPYTGPVPGMDGFEGDDEDDEFEGEDDFPEGDIIDVAPVPTNGGPVRGKNGRFLSKQERAALEADIVIDPNTGEPARS